MSTTRRDFLELAAVAGGALGLGLTGTVAAAGREEVAKAERPLRILVLGGTGFIGPHIVRRALARGHRVSIFNRGKTRPDLFPEVEKLRGDRKTGDIAALEGHEWDAVIDNSASIPRWVRDSAGLLAKVAGQYLYTSSISAYADTSKPGMDETAPLATLEDPTVEDVSGGTYGGLKALCEKEAEKAFGDRTTIVRPGLIVGPGDGSDRFTYWPARIDRGGEVLAPGDPDDPVQFIDARDLASWYIHLVETRTTGVFNATGPASPLPVAGMLYGIRAVTSTPVTFTWVDADFLEAHEVAPWQEMTVWVPPRAGYEGFSRVSNRRALEAKLTFRPLAETARDTLDWWKSLPEERRAKPRAGLAPAKEAEVLAAWHARKPGAGPATDGKGTEGGKGEEG